MAILNPEDIVPYGIIEDAKPRIYVAGDDRDIDKMDWSAINAELTREDKTILNPQVRDASSAILSTNKKQIPRRKPIIDWKTNNESFLELHEDLKILGVDNNKFFLRLFDPDLQGINPFLPNLPIDLQIKIFFEVWINPWYFLREICRIPEDGKAIEVGGGSEFKIDRTSVATWFLFLNGIDHYGSKPRQCGKTQDAIAKQLYGFNWGCTATQFLFFNKDFPQAKVNLYRLKCQREMLPNFLKMEYAYTEDGRIDKGINNVTSMRNPINGNQIKCMTKATSIDIANSQGRGDTAAMHYMDEFDFWPYGTTIMKAAAFAYSKASENAIKNNSLHCRICTSTPGFTSSRDGSEAVKFIDQCVQWEDKYLDMPINQLNSIIHGNKRNGFVYVEHTWKQLKKTEKWYERQCELVGYDENTIAREIDLKRISGNELNPLKKEHQVYIAANTIEPIDRIDYSDNLCPFLIYEKLHREYPYLLIVDPAEGLGADHDNNAVIVLNPYTLRTVIEYKSPYVSQPNLFKMLDKLLIEYIPHSCVIVEANKGRELINLFSSSVWNMNLWYDADKLNSKIVEVEDEYGEAQKASHLRKALGFDTSSKTRPHLFRTLEVLAEEQIDTLCTKNVAKDTLGLIKKPTGRIEAGKGEHDDCIMAKLIGHFVYDNASNLEEFGIVKGQREPVHEDKPRTEEENLEKLREMLPGLPQAIRDLFASTAQRNPISDANQYYKQVENERRAREVARNPVGNTAIPNGANRVTGSQSDALWNQFYAEQSAGNPYSGAVSPYGSDDGSMNGGRDFNLEDYV